jgi:hypothetical protein
MEAMQGWQRLVGRWVTEGSHPFLPGEAITGDATFAWLGEGQFLVMRAHYDHPQIPDALTVTGIVDGALTMHYYDPRGVHRQFLAEMSGDTWRFWNDVPGFAQRYAGTFGDGDRVIRCQVETCRDGTTWDPDLELTYRRVE